MNRGILLLILVVVVVAFLLYTRKEKLIVLQPTEETVQDRLRNIRTRLARWGPNVNEVPPEGPNTVSEERAAIIQQAAKQDAEAPDTEVARWNASSLMGAEKFLYQNLIISLTKPAIQQ